MTKTANDTARLILDLACSAECAPMRDWDAGADHPILKAAGGKVTAPDGERLRYGADDLLIPGFIASGQGGHQDKPRNIVNRVYSACT